MRVDVAIIGAGFAGIGAAIALERAGRPDFVVLERANAVGGTWRDNVYPGVACDIPSHLYSYSFMPNPEWSRVFAPGAEIRDYLEGAIDATGIRDRIRLDSPLEAAVWDEDAEVWRLTVGSSPSHRDREPATIEARALVLAAGRLTEPRIPDIPGLMTFSGPVIHTARWDDSLELDGKRIAVIGSGASAVQIAPELARRSHVTVFQRTPAWVLPRADREYAEAEQERFATDPTLIDAIRQEAYLAGEAMIPQRLGDLDALDWAQARALAHLHAQVPDPALRAAMMPAYEIGCKRAVFSDDWYPAIASGAIELEASALVGVRPFDPASPRSGTGTGGGVLVAASGAEHEADVVVLATGFHSTRQPYARLVAGAAGETLDEHWATGMTSVASTMVSGFPSLFVLDGPNASLGHNSSILMIEAQVDYLLEALDHRDAHGGGALHPTADAEAEYTARIDAAAASTVWLTGGCRSWYVDERSGRLTLLWPDSVPAFRTHGARFNPDHFAVPAHSRTPFAPLHGV
ncbi:MAG TPA: NAD(P)/FAD-dependent oxidoreductase [Microbacteriaceae bacterium]|nr:NAD(P)/FAD-dependent oxidoreductase [Microbacteriaceae bacterium]